MEEFIYELPEGKNQDVLARTIQGRSDFRRFKDKLDNNIVMKTMKKLQGNGVKDIRLILLNERKGLL